jgi:hypothetical protein
MPPYLKDLLPTEGPPRTLYRIYDNRSFNKRTLGGFFAGDITPFDMHDALAVQDAVESHLDWHNRDVLTPFISTSNSAGWTRVNAIRRQNNGNGNVMIAVISTAMARNVPIYSMQTVADATGAVVNHPCDHEWVFVGHIPNCAIIAEYNVAKFEIKYLQWLEHEYLHEKLEFLDIIERELEGKLQLSSISPLRVTHYFVRYRAVRRGR